MGYTKEKRLVNSQLGRNKSKEVIPAGEQFNIPNHSGDHSAGHTGTPVNDTDIANKKYVDNNTGAWTSSGNDIYYNTGNVGIGTASPDKQLEIYKDDTGAAAETRLKSVGNAATNYVDLIQTSRNSLGGDGYFDIQWDGSSILKFKSNGQGVQDDWDFKGTRIIDVEAIGIGTSSPGNPLHVYGSGESLAYFQSSDALSRIAIGDPSDILYIGTNDAKGFFGFAADVNANNLVIDSSGNVGIGTTSPGSKLEVNGGIRMPASTTESRWIEVGIGRTGNGYSFIDLVGDATYTDYGLRLIRLNAGANTNSKLEHRGTGGLIIEASDAGFVSLYTNANERMRIVSGGNIGIGTGAPATSAKVEIASTTGALLLPRMTTTQRDALTAVNGMLIYNTTNNVLEAYENGAWVNI